MIVRSDLTGKIYIKNGNKKTDITDEVVINVQILLDKGFKFNSLYNKIEDKTYELVLRVKE
jgi:hypothetical protein